MTERKPLGERADVEAVAALASVAGMTVVDVGCGAGKSSRELAALGATVIAVEPDPISGGQEPHGRTDAGRRLP